MTTHHIPLRKRSLVRTAARVGAIALVFAASNSASAGGTRTVRVNDFDEFDSGEADGTAIESSGRITAGFEHERVALDAGLAFACASGRSEALVATGGEAALWRLRPSRKGPSATQLAKLEGQVVTAVARHGSDWLVASLPGGAVHRLDAKGKLHPFATIDGVKQIWAIVPHRGRILLATGPKGQVWSVAGSGKDAKLELDTDEEHVLSLATTGDHIFAGTAPHARVYRLAKDPAGLLVRDFAGDEVRALTVAGTHLVAAVNHFNGGDVSGVNALSKAVAKAAFGSEPTKEKNLELKTRAAKATLHAVDLGPRRDVARANDAAWTEWFSKSKQYFTGVLPLDSGDILVSSSSSGKIYRARGPRDVATVADLDEKQATGLCRLGKSVLATVGDGAAAYQLRTAKAKTALYRSKVFDADQPSRYGALTIRGRGSVQVRARVGPTEEVDAHWTRWAAVPVRLRNAVLEGDLSKLPHRRFLQLELQLVNDNADVRGIELFYSPENVAPMMKSVSVRTPSFDLDDDDEPSSKVTIKWRADARDDDDLVYRVRARPEADDVWIPLHDPTERVSKSELKWDVSSVPAGVYRIEVEASDEPSNGTGAALRDDLVSDPVLVDHERPTITIKQASGQRISLQVQDAGSRVHDVAFSVDDGAFRSASPRDGLFDTGDEGVEITLPDELTPGPHRVTVRARDAFGNIATVARIVRR